MTVQRFSALRSIELGRHGWNALAKYQNISMVTDLICERHRIPRKHRQNAGKQAEQIRYCLRQAKEYRDASLAVTVATKPVLQYYSIMSLALAEILLKQDGNSSLDRAREQHRHHGLNFVQRSSSLEIELQKAAAALYAIPSRNKENQPFGTFELWHRSAREAPLGGKYVEHRALNHVTGFHLLLQSNDEPLSPLPKSGISFLECCRCIPAMSSFLGDHGIPFGFIRTTVQGEFRDALKRHQITIVIHPTESNLLSKFYGSIAFRPSDYECLEVREYDSGCALTITYGENFRIVVELPNAITIDTKETWFYPEKKPLNEFGYYYTALFILGNYARYYPDRWLQDVERSTPIGLAAEELAAAADDRVPHLILSEFSGTYYALER
ncbi:YaaC family protein [Alsobacter soli]|uniref:YaaC family protein n=1 Tax=Alsobacter soli TaxID=2109933 RepID=UPI0011B25337|nr:YaaC family protein [Alsobacter soli]